MPGRPRSFSFKDALAQAEAENAAWPYNWFKLGGYVPESGRGTVTGKLAIADPGNPASLARQHLGRAGATTADAQLELRLPKICQGVPILDEDRAGRLVPHPACHRRCQLHALGLWSRRGGHVPFAEPDGRPAPMELDVPAKPFAVRSRPALRLIWALSPGRPSAWEQLSSNWATRIARPTSFAMARITGCLSHRQSSAILTPIWGGEREFVLDNPNGLTYTVGQNQWPRDWSYIIPAPPDATGVYQPSTGTITFNLPAAPAADAKASVYLGCAGDESGGIIVSVNGTNLGIGSECHRRAQPCNRSGFRSARQPIPTTAPSTTAITGPSLTSELISPAVCCMQARIRSASRSRAKRACRTSCSTTCGWS